MNKSSHNNKQELGISDLIALLSAIGLWSVVYLEIVRLSSDRDSQNLLNSMVLIHGLLSVHLSFMVFIIHYRFQSKPSWHFHRVYLKCDQYLRATWFPSILFSLIIYILSSFESPVSHACSLAFNIFLSLFLVLILLKFLQMLEVCIFFCKYVKDIGIWSIILFIILVIYGFILYSISPKIEIVFHKEVFIDEDVTFTIKRSGYIARPDVMEVKLNNCNILPMRDSKIYRIRKDSVKWNSDSNYLDVKYGSKCSNKIKNVEVPYLSK